MSEKLPANVKVRDLTRPAALKIPFVNCDSRHVGQLGTVVGGISPPAFALARGRRPSLDVSIVLSASRRRARGGDSSPARTISLGSCHGYAPTTSYLIASLPDLRIAVSSHEDSLAHFWYPNGKTGRALGRADPSMRGVAGGGEGGESKEISLTLRWSTAKDFGGMGSPPDTLAFNIEYRRRGTRPRRTCRVRLRVRRVGDVGFRSQVQRTCTSRGTGKLHDRLRLLRCH